MLLERNGKFLNKWYQWSLMPHAFPDWQFQDVLDEAMQYKDKPLRIGEVVDGKIVLTEISRLTNGADIK